VATRVDMIMTLSIYQLPVQAPTPEASATITWCCRAAPKERKADVAVVDVRDKVGESVEAVLTSTSDTLKTHEGARNRNWALDAKHVSRGWPPDNRRRIPWHNGNANLL
jgi:hypothetical protein